MAKQVGVLDDATVAKIARDELNEDLDRREADLTAIKEWAAKQPHLANIRLDDDYILYFLRGCKYSLERTKEKLDFFNSVRAACPEWFDDWDKLDDCFSLIKAGAYVLLNGFDKNGRRVFLFRTAAIDPNKYTLNEIYRVHYMVMEILMDKLDQGSVTGFVSMSDSKDTTMAHVGMFSNPVLAKKSATVFQDAYPTRPKAMHILNLPSIMESVLNMFKTFLNEKMKNRFIIHAQDDYSQMDEMIGKDVLPAEYGGTNGTLQDHIESFVQLFESKKDWLKEQTKYKSDEAKRPGKPRNYSDIFGMEGSFRQLKVD